MVKTKAWKMGPRCAMLPTKPLANRRQRGLREGRSAGHQHRVGKPGIITTGFRYLRRSVLAKEAEVDNLNALGGEQDLLSITRGRGHERAGDRDVLLDRLGLVGDHLLKALLFTIHAGREQGPQGQRGEFLKK